MKIVYSVILALTLVLLSHLLLTGIATAQGPSDGIPEGYILIEDDILVPENFFDSGGIDSQAVWDTNTTFWPNGVVPYQFAPTVTMVSQTNMISAMLQWENVANVDFRPKVAADQFYVLIQNSTENSSPVGRQPLQNQPQPINIVSWNSTFIMAHELAHALGLWHEQSRPDRDSYVTINTQNITPSSAITVNFNKRTAADVYPKQAYGLAGDKTYDFGSVMHYGQYAFSKCAPFQGCGTPLPTIVVKPPYNTLWQNQIGQRDRLSNLDKLTVSFLYPRNGWFFVDQTYTGAENGTFINPYKQFITGVNNAPSGSTLWIQPGSYSAIGTYNKPMYLESPLGNVVLGP
jgi:hypothetical protein